MSKIELIIENLKKYRPEKVFLFGSYAWGKPRINSDMDLLVIKKTKKDQYKRIPEVRGYLHNINQAFDILVLTPQEMSRRLKMGDFFIEEIVNRGKVLYEAKQ